MKNKIALFIFSLFALVLLAAALSLRRVDRAPLKGSVHERCTLDRLHSLELDPGSGGPLHAGFGLAGLTPPVGTPLAGYGARKGAPSTGVHDSLFVRVIALRAGERTACLVGYDALLLHPPLARQIERGAYQQMGLDPEQLYFTATHTHSGAGGWGKGWLSEQFAGPRKEGINEMFVDSTLAALSRALRDLHPARYGCGVIDAPHFIRNRLVGEAGETDDDLFYLALLRDNRPGAVFASYSAHATVLSARNLEFSGDYPGFFERGLERLSGAKVIFAAAGVGSHSHRGEGSGFERAQRIGTSLADSIYSRLKRCRLKSSARLIYGRLAVDLPPHQVLIAAGWRLAPWLARRLVPVDQVYLQILALDRTAFIGSPGEFSGEMALEVKAEAHELGWDVTVTSFNGNYIGYLTPSHYAGLDNYETRTMSWFGPHTGDYISGLAQSAVQQLADRFAEDAGR